MTQSELTVLVTRLEKINMTPQIWLGHITGSSRVIYMPVPLGPYLNAVVWPQHSSLA